MTTLDNLTCTVESLQNLCLSYATGGGGDEGEYRELRRQVLDNPSVSDKLPRFVRTCRDLGQFWAYIKGFAPTYAERRQHIWDGFRPLLERLEAGGDSPAAEEAAERMRVVDSPHVQAAWQSASLRKDSDPEGAITAARTLVESVCKHILDETNSAYDDTWELPKLYKATAEALTLAPNQHSEQIFRQILGGCQTVVEGLGALRNKHGDAHGKGRGSVRPAPRHAALAVNLGGTMASFLIATFEERGFSK